MNDQNKAKKYKNHTIKGVLQKAWDIAYRKLAFYRTVIKGEKK